MTIGDKNIKVTSWQDVFIEFLKWLKDSQEYDFNIIYDNQNELFRQEKTIINWSELKTIVSKTPKLKSRYKTFDGEFCNKVQIEDLHVDLEFIHINCSASAFMSRIANVMNKFNISEDFISITLK